MSIIARLGVVLGLNSAEFTKGLDEATKKTKEFERNQKAAAREAATATQDMIKNFGAAGVAAGLLAAGFVKVTKAADDMMDTAAAFDTTIESLIATKAAMQAAGGEAENYSTLMQKLASVQDGAREGSDTLREAFNRLGISGKDVDNLKLDEMFNRVATELAKVEDATKRNALAQDLLGKAAKGINWADYVDNYKKVADPNLAAAIRENAEAWQNIESTMKSIDMLVQKLTAPFSALLNMMFDLVKTYNDIKEGGDANVDWGAAFGGMPGEEGASTFHAGQGKKPSGPISKPGQIGGYAKASDKEIAAAAAAFKQKLHDLLDASKKFDAQMEKLGGSLQTIQTTQIQKVQNLKDEYDIKTELLDLENKRYSMSIDEYENSKMYLDQKIRKLEIEKEAINEIAAAQIEMERASTEDALVAKLIFEEKVKNIKILKDIQLAQAEELQRLEIRNFDAEKERQYDFIEGFKHSYQRASEENAKIFKLGEQAFSNVMGNMESAIQNFVKTGKLNFKDFTRSVIQDLLAIAMKAQLIRLFDLIKLPVGSVSVGAFASGGNAGGGFVGGGYGSIGHAAAGGPISGPTLVGENGPELFMPNSPGTIVPNGSWQQMSNNKGGMTINGPYIANMSTIDSKSFEERIYESNKAVWAAGKYAEKSLAVSGGRS